MITQLEREVAKLKQGDHVCPIHESLAQQMGAALPFIKTGIEQGERVFYGAENAGLRKMNDALVDARINVDNERARGTLSFVNTREVYARAGKFDPRAMIGFLHDLEMAALAAGFSGARFIGDMTWVLGTDFDAGQLVEYEAMLNSYVAKSRAIVLCQYDRTRFDLALIHDILRVHPIAMIGDFVCQNPYCEPPELIIRRDRGDSDEYKRKRVSWWITRLKEVAEIDQERAEAEHRYRTLFEVSLSGVFLLHEGVMVDCNGELARMFGVPREEIIGRALEQFSPPAQPDGQPSGDSAREKIRNALAGEPQLFEWAICRPDGMRLDCEIGLRSFELTGKTYLQALARDITERKQAQEEAQRVQQQMESLLDSAGEGILGADAEGRCTFVNRAATEMLGYESEQMLGANIHDLIHHHRSDGSVYPCEECPILRALHTNERCRVGNEVFWRADGACFPVEYSSCPIIENGVVTGGVITFADITERGRAEERIAEQAALLDQARDAVLVRDLGGNILFWSKGAERIYGWTREEVMGRNMGERFVLDDRQKLHEANRLLLEQGDWHGEFQHNTKDGRKLTVEARWALVRDKDGQPKSVLAINTDITEKKNMQAQLVRSQRMDGIGALAGGVAHDLNNILTPILMSIAVLRFTVKDAKSQRVLQTIEVSSKRGADIVRQILSFARGLEGARVEVQPKRLFQDIRTIIEDTFPKNIRLELPTGASSWPVLGDATQLLQVLLNLCVNARDAMPDGGSLVITAEDKVLDAHYATMHADAKPGRYVTIGVTDSGMGIPPAIIAKIFEPFFTTKEVEKGTGLGLSTVMGIVKSHDGFVEVSSELGHGTAFKIYLPAAIGSREVRKETVPGAALRGNGEAILIVDDEASILAITSQTLEAFGYQILTARDGVEAVTIYARRREEIAAVLTDISMPIMDGGTTIRVLMKINPNVKIIAASGLNADRAAVKAAEAVVKKVLSKPYTAETLLKALRNVLDED
jgi:PAS domain S-box-containing protein